MFNRGQLGVVQMGMALVLAAVGCGGTALEGGGDAGGGSTPPSSHSDPEIGQVGPPSSTAPGTAGSSGVYVAPDYGNAGGASSYGNTSAGGYGPIYAAGGGGPIYEEGGYGDIAEIGEGGYAEDDCSSPPSGPALTPWKPQRVADEPVSQLLADARAKLSGNWRGIVTTLFVAPFSIVLSFHSDGSYSAHCSEHSDYDGSSPGCCRALYYGSDQDTPLKQWTLSTADVAGSTSGDLDIIYSYPQGFGESGYQGRISNLEFDAADLRARFTFVYGEIIVGTYDLERTP